MPYSIVNSWDGYKVKDTQTGRLLSYKPLSRSDAEIQLKALQRLETIKELPLVKSKKLKEIKKILKPYN